MGREIVVGVWGDWKPGPGFMRGISILTNENNRRCWNELALFYTSTCHAKAEILSFHSMHQNSQTPLMLGMHTYGTFQRDCFPPQESHPFISFSLSWYSVQHTSEPSNCPSPYSHPCLHTPSISNPSTSNLPQTPGSAELTSAYALDSYCI